MRNSNYHCTLLLISLVFFLASSVVCASQFYMFKDRSGRTVIQDSIPPDRVKFGYKIVNDRGVTIEVVPSEREQRRRLVAAQKEKSESSQAAREKADKKERDERLFQSFSSAEEIRVAGNKKIMAVQLQIDTTVKHIQAFENNLEKLEKQRAAGGNENSQAIADLQKSIRQNNAFVVRKRAEQNRIRDEYVGYIQRYQLLSIQRQKHEGE